MKLTIKNLTTSDLLNLEVDLETMREQDKLSPEVHLNNETGYFELSIHVDYIGLLDGGMLAIKKYYVGAEANIPIIMKRNIIIETEV